MIWREVFDCILGREHAVDHKAAGADPEREPDPDIAAGLAVANTKFDRAFRDLESRLRGHDA